MSFVTALALAVGLLVALPFLAHLLRRGKTEEFEFPPANLVPEKAITAKQRSRLEDRLLLLLRALSVAALAILGATPLAQCSRLSVERPSGASIALALVIDDSQSMQAKVSEGVRWDVALAGANQLLASARTGDSITLVLAGHPARILVSPTADLALVRSTLNDLRVTDRSTDLSGAVRLAEALLQPLPQLDKRVVVLSDLAAPPWPPGNTPVSAPLTALREPSDNCALTQAERQGDAVLLTVACSSAKAAEGRTIQALVAGSQGKATRARPDAGAVGAAANGSLAGSITLPPEAGIQTLQVAIKVPGGQQLEVALSPPDANPRDDRAWVAGQTTALSVGVVADPGKTRVLTGGATVIEQALVALNDQIIVKPLPLLPEAVTDLQPLSLLVIDDTPGLSPEARTALQEWLVQGGVVVGLLGPGAQSAQLSSNLEPFAKGGPWERLQEPLSASAEAAAWLTVEKDSLVDLTHTGRVRLDGADLPGSTVALRWSDGVPLILERAANSGLVLTVGLPAAVDVSDLSLRPVFLSLLGHALEQAQARRGPARSVVGTPWLFRPDAAVLIESPSGPVPLQRSRGGNDSLLTGGEGSDETSFTPQFVGQYRVKLDGQVQNRIVTLEPDEVVRTPTEPPPSDAAQGAAIQSQVDISREVALGLLALLTLELLTRVFGPYFRRKPLAS